MDAPILVFQGVAFALLQFVRNVTDGVTKEYFVVNTGGSTGQAFKFGGEIDGSILANDLSTTIQIQSDDGLVPVTVKQASKDGKLDPNAVRLSGNFNWQGKPWHVDGKISRKANVGTYNLKFNVVKGHFGGGGQAKTVQAVKVSLPK